MKRVFGTLRRSRPRHLSQRTPTVTRSHRHPRNLTDAQLDAIAASGGVVGLNYATCFLRDDGKMSADTPLDALLRHLARLLDRLGEQGVALGSDFDGAVMPAEIGDVSGNQRFVAAMRAHGLGEALVERICYRNWSDLLGRTWQVDAVDKCQPIAAHG